MNKIYCLLFFLVATTSLVAQSAVRLTFARTGTTADDVSVSLTDQNGAAIQGATATLQSNTPFKATAGAISEAILCPNVNATAKPSISLTLTISGLPTNFSYNTAALDLHALNGGNQYQNNTDNGVSRQWNIDFCQTTDATAPTQWASLSDIEVAYGVGQSGAVHKDWTLAGQTTAASATHTIQINISSGAENKGCFLGLSSITLSTQQEEPPLTFSPDSLYRISWKNTNGNFITEGDDGYAFVQGKDNHARQLWQLVPVGQEPEAYYIRSAVSGLYLQSCNQQPASASRIKTGAKPIPYYIGQTSATSSEIANCYWLSSTDCANYDDENQSPRALNKDGGSSNVITWQAGTNRVGSYWTISYATGDSYEPQPFKPSDTIGRPIAEYAIQTASGKRLDWQEETAVLNSPATDFSQYWYFVGSSNAQGYQIVNKATDKPLADETTGSTLWTVNAPAGLASQFFFLPLGAETGALCIEGDSLFTFPRQRSSFARNAQIYTMPCATASSTYLQSLWLTTLQYSAQSAPTDAYDIVAHQSATLQQGDTLMMNIEWSNALPSHTEAWLYFDWDRDGLFEQSILLGHSKQCDEWIAVPATAKVGKSRMRMRLTDNGLTQPDDDVIGQAIDFYVSVDPLPDDITAVNSANAPLTISTHADIITAHSTLGAVSEIKLYALNGTLLLSAKGKSLKTDSLPQGVYIVSAKADGHTLSNKFTISK